MRFNLWLTGRFLAFVALVEVPPAWEGAGMYSQCRFGVVALSVVVVAMAGGGVAGAARTRSSQVAPVSDALTPEPVGHLHWACRLVLGGILAGFSGNWWTSGRYWIWASLVLAVVLIGLMTPMGRIYLNRVREAVGIDPKTGAVDSSKQVDPAAVEAAIASGQPILLAVLGTVGLAILFWLMIAKPF